eukprot:353459-Chlamydomonas_euryale.AAC.2
MLTCTEAQRLTGTQAHRLAGSQAHKASHGSIRALLLISEIPKERAAEDQKVVPEEKERHSHSNSTHDMTPMTAISDRAAAGLFATTSNCPPHAQPQPPALTPTPNPTFNSNHCPNRPPTQTPTPQPVVVADKQARATRHKIDSKVGTTVGCGSGTMVESGTTVGGGSGTMVESGTLQHWGLARRVCQNGKNGQNGVWPHGSGEVGCGTKA